MTTNSQTTPEPVRAKKGCCIHYTGVFGPGMKCVETCNAGVNYRDLAGGDGPGWIAKIPCTPPIGHSKIEDQVACPLRQLPTDEQIRLWNEYIDKRVFGMLNARSLCVEDAKKNGCSHGSIKCPSCDAGEVRYSIAECNGHVWGQCSTKGCLSWME